jgi:hypothetical protein
MTTREAALRELSILEDAEWDTPERRERLLRLAGMWEEPTTEAETKETKESRIPDQPQEILNL